MFIHPYITVTEDILHSFVGAYHHMPGCCDCRTGSRGRKIILRGFRIIHETNPR